MADPITLTAIGTIALTEGVKFLYSQAGDVLKRWRERKEAKQDTPADQTTAVDVKLPTVFEGQLSTPKIHFDVVERLEDDLRQVRHALADYADGVEVVDPQNQALLRTVDALRQAMEAIFQQRLTFKGEQRPTSGPVVEARIDVQTVAGYVAGVRAGTISNGHIVVEVSAKDVEKSGQVTGVDAGTIQ